MTDLRRTRKSLEPEQSLQSTSALSSEALAVHAAPDYTLGMRQPSETDMSFAAFERMLRSLHGLKLLLAGMPPGSTLEEARFLHRKLKQAARRPCSFLDEELGIRR